MKKTFNINVAGFPFIIDEDAYTLLSEYIDTIEHAFAHLEDGVEVVNDIESRIAELLMECTAEESPIVSIANVEEVISRVGKPEEMIEDDIKISVNESDGAATVTEQETEKLTPPPYIPPIPPLKRKLYRDSQNSMLGGVCSGIAWYLKMDTTMVRLLTVLITIISVSTCGIAYLILWIVIPEASTPLQRMEMMGEEPTVENIGKTVTDNFREDNNPNSTTITGSGLGSTIAKIFSIIVKILIIIGMILAVILLGALVIGFLGCLFALIMFGTSWSGTMFGEISPIFNDGGTIPFYGLLCGIGGILVVGIPLFMLVRKGWKKPAPLSSSLKTILTILWIVGFIMAAISTGRIINIEYEQEREWQQQRHEQYEAIYDQIDSQIETAIESAVASIDSALENIDSIPYVANDSIASK